MEKEIWDKEIDVARKRDAVDTLVKQVNSLALQEGMRTQSGEVVSLLVHSFQGAGGREDEISNNSTRAELGEMAKCSRTTTRNTDRELQTAVSTTEQGKREVMTRKNEMDLKEKDLSKIIEEIAKTKEQIETEEKNLNTELLRIKDQLHQLKSKDKMNKEGLERELLAAKGKFKALQLQREKYRSDGLEFLRKVSARAASYIEECTAYRDRAVAAVLEVAKARVELVKKARFEIEEKVEQALQDTKRDDV